jgi:hypothetical protein
MPTLLNRAGTALRRSLTVSVIVIIGMGEACWLWMSHGYCRETSITPLFTDVLSVVMWVLVVAAWNFDQQFRLDSPPPSHPMYYWTSCWSWQQDSGDEPDPDYLSYMAGGMRAFAPHQLTVTIWRVVGPSHVVTWPLGPAENSGTAPFDGAIGPLSTCVLIDFYASGNRVGYKRVRGWPPGLMRGAVWDSALIAWLRDHAVPNILPLVPLCNRAGVLFDDYEVRPEIHNWQQRHGSKRAARPVFVLP